MEGVLGMVDDDALKMAERTVRMWHKTALQMRDLAIDGKCAEIERVYFDAAMSFPFYGVDPDPLPSERAEKAA